MSNLFGDHPLISNFDQCCLIILVFVKYCYEIFILDSDLRLNIRVVWSMGSSLKCVITEFVYQKYLKPLFMTNF